MESFMSDPIKINPTFDFEKSNITESSIRDEISDILNQKNLVQDEINIFPIEVFPKAVQQIIIDTNQNLNFPLDFIGASMLFAASVAIGNTFRIEIKTGFQESAVLYMAIVARAGTNKTHPLSFAVHPILEKDKRTYAQYEQQKLLFDKSIILTKQEREEQGLDEPVKPVWHKCILSDYTPEALVEVHKFNKRGIGVYVDELAGWFKNFNRYNKGSEAEFWLSNWNSKPINIDRKKAEPVFIPLPFISVAGTIQNGILYELAKDNRTQNGFIDRILFVIPDNIQKPYWNDSEINPEIIDNWNVIISNLLNLTVEYDDTLNPIPEILHFSSQAKKLLFDWQRKNTDQSNDAENESVSGIISKMDMFAVRLSLILELMYSACGDSTRQSVGIDAVRGALQLVEYFKKSAIKVCSIIQNVNPLDKLPVDKKNLYLELPDTFTTEVGLNICSQIGFAERTFKRFLNNKELFKRLQKGQYEKLF
jgi:hypothetical protein